jgi:hypothetical protein
MRVSSALLRLAILLGLGLVAPSALAVHRDPDRSEAHGAAHGRPRVVVDRVELREAVDNPSLVRKKLMPILKREGRHADWGAGSGSRVTFRFELTELRVEGNGDVLRVHCQAVGRLPRGRRARGGLVFSGDAAKKNELVERTLEIVARGVITRLAELERKRRGLLASR